MMESVRQELSNSQEEVSPKSPQASPSDRTNVTTHQKVALNSPRVAQLSAYGSLANSGTIQRQASQGGLPTQLQSGIESLSGIAMNDVRVHYNSAKPAQLQAHAYAQGTDIHLAPGQEKHLAHEAWHVVQQKQGRVKPTLQLKGIAINDDSALEREADVMGAKALTASTPAKSLRDTGLHDRGPVQRVMQVNGADMQMDAAATHFEENASGPRAIRIARQTVLPAWHAQNKEFGSQNIFIGRLMAVVDMIDRFTNLSEAHFLADLIQQQRNLQETALDNDLYNGLLTTVGFEHEFADMYGSPLAGVSHLELGRSAESLPYTDIHFILETDASNALEMVSPPFLLPTVANAPLPDHEVVGEHDLFMRRRLAHVSPAIEDMARFELLGRPEVVALTEILQHLNAETGLNFSLFPNLSIGSKHMSFNTNLNQVAGILNPGQVADVEAGNLPLALDQVGAISVGKSKKSFREPEHVSGQVNIATDMQTASTMLTPSVIGGGKIYRDLEQQLAAVIPAHAMPQVNLFRQVMISKLVSLFSVYSQEQVVAQQATLFERLQQVGPNAPAPALEEDAKGQFIIHASWSSYVKDGSMIWLKDHLISLAKGILTTDETRLAAREMVDAAFLPLLTLEALPSLSQPVYRQVRHSTAAAHWDSYIMLLTQVVTALNQSLENAIPDDVANAHAEVPLYGHDAHYIGARQDTYLRANRVQQPGLWPGRRLHVAEIRRGDPAVLLEQAKNRLPAP